MTMDDTDGLDRRQFLASSAIAAIAAATPAGAAGPAGLDICYMDAVDLAAKIRSRELSSVEVMTAFLDRIDAVNPTINAIVSMIPREQAMALARQADADLAAGLPVGKLHGLPWAVKDTEDVAGFPTISGSPLYKDYVASGDTPVVARLRAAGELFIGKTNVPEMAAGSNTFNPVFGITRSAFNPEYTVGGSTGGGAVAVATGMVPMADGVDTGGSCRNPGAWNNIIGFRTSIGRIANLTGMGFFARLTAHGPMARTARDAGYLLSVMAGYDPRDPLSINEDPEIFARPLDRDFTGTRVAWTPDLGYLPVEKEVIDVTATAIPVLERIGCLVDNAHPDMTGAFETNKTIRAALYSLLASSMTPDQLGMMKEALQFEAATGAASSGIDIARAEAQRTVIYQNLRAFMETYEFLVLPVTQVTPFKVEVEYPTEINGQQMRTYLEWMEIVYAITLTGHPAISVPVGFTSLGLPLGLQIVGRKGDDLGVLQLAHAFQQAAGIDRSPVPRI